MKCIVKLYSDRILFARLSTCKSYHVCHGMSVLYMFLSGAVRDIDPLYYICACRIFFFLYRDDQLLEADLRGIQEEMSMNNFVL